MGEVFAAEIYSAVFGDDIVGLEARGDHPGAGSEDGLDFVETLVGCGGHGEERYAALAARGAIDEVVLSAYAREYALADRVGAYLACKVNFEA